MDTSTIIGVLVGAAIAVLGSLATVAGGYIAGAKRDRKDNVRRAAGSFLTACDELWSADQTVQMTVVTNVHNDLRPDFTNEQRRRAANHQSSVFAKQADANWNARRIRDELDLLEPKVSVTAHALYVVCSSGNTGPSPIPSVEQEAARTAARAAFLAAARRRV